jgi:hypothetical protein
LPATLDEVGLSHKESQAYQQLAAAPASAIEHAVAQANAEQRPVTKADRRPRPVRANRGAFIKPQGESRYPPPGTRSRMLAGASSSSRAAASGRVSGRSKASSPRRSGRMVIT